MVKLKIEAIMKNKKINKKLLFILSICFCIILILLHTLSEFFMTSVICFVISIIAYVEERNIIRDWENGEEDEFKLRPYNSLRHFYRNDRGKYMKSLNDLIIFGFFAGCGLIIAGFADIILGFILK